MNRHLRHTLMTLAIATLGSTIPAQEHIPGKVDIPWNRYYDHAELNTLMR